MTPSLKLLTLAAAFAAAPFAHAQTSTWTIDSTHSGVEFQIKHLGVATVRGSFSKVTGKIILDEKDVTHSSVDAIIDTNTVNTNDQKRDEHLRSPDFFDTAKFPTITFKSTGLSKLNGKLQMMGTLTLDGVSKPITLDLDGPAAPQKGMGGKTVSGFSATGVLSRSVYGFGSKYTAPVLGDEVKFTIDIEMDK